MSATTGSKMFFSGETESRAVLAAANHFGVSPEQVVFDRVEKRHGFVKNRRVVIRVDPARVGEAPAPVDEVAAGAEQVEAVAEADVPAEETNAASAGADAPLQRADPEESAESAPVQTADTEEDIESTEEILDTARAAMDQLLELADLEVSADMVFANGRIEVEIEGVDQELLTEDEGQVLLALQHLLPRVMYGKLGRIVPCRLDSGGYQRKKEERLRGLARRVAEEVVQRGGMRTLRPMNPADRRIVHMTLADDSEVETESHGNGYFKRVNIRCV